MPPSRSPSYALCTTPPMQVLPRCRPAVFTNRTLATLRRPRIKKVHTKRWQKARAKQDSSMLMKGAAQNARSQGERASIISLLCQVDGAGDQQRDKTQGPQAASPHRPRGEGEVENQVADIGVYVKSIQHDVFYGGVAVGSPWVCPENPFQTAAAINKKRHETGERHLDGKEALNLVLRPAMFLWAPEKIFPGVRVKCPSCGQVCSTSFWGDIRTLHGTSAQSLYVATRHQCSKCKACGKKKGAKTKQKKSFLADSAAVLSLLPMHVRSAWSLVDTGQVLCDASLGDLLRSCATKCSWAAMAKVIHEQKDSAWTRDVVLRYLHLCDFLGIAPCSSVPRKLPSQYALTEKWVRNFFVTDYRTREREVDKELGAEVGDDIMMVDWTKKAASRCSASYLFNVMAGSKKVLASVLTRSAGPWEVQGLLTRLRDQGVKPKVFYVDDECCGAWPSILKQVWPQATVRLDALHALRRLTQTTSSTQHPRHGKFCSMLSEAVFSYDLGILRRLQTAMARHGMGAPPQVMKRAHVPRVIKDAPRIIRSIDHIMDVFDKDCDDAAGALITADTRNAWANLREHVSKGCLCDPPDVNLHMYVDSTPLEVGGELFRRVESLRGTSRLEGYHCHQKLWLGTLGTHGREAGIALLTDGCLRWNRERGNEAATGSEQVPSVFAGGLLSEARRLRQQAPGAASTREGDRLDDA